MRGRREVVLVSRCWRPAVWLLLSLLVSVLLVAMSVLLHHDGDVKVSLREVPALPPSHPSAHHTQTPAIPRYEVQLVNGQGRCEGRVEVRSGGGGGAWGTVCDDDWDMVDANVVCRQLDCGLAMAVGTSSQFGQGSGAIWLDNVDCAGGETDLSQCGSLGWAVHNCYHYEDVAVFCRGNQVILQGRGPQRHTTPAPGVLALRDGAIQLVGGRDRCQGRVEVYYRGSWGTVCDDDWGLRNAEVVCRQIQCGRAVSALRNSYFGYGRGEILLDNVNCTGNELMLSRCYSLGWGTNNCGHHEDASVICASSGLTTPPPPANTESMNVWPPEGGRGFFPFTNLTPVANGTLPVTQTTETTTTTTQAQRALRRIRVVNGNSSCAGRVEVYYATIWGTVCDDDWDMTNARVVCRQLGCGTAIAAKGLAFYGYGEGPILMDNVDCLGTELDVGTCFHLGWGQHNCGHHEDAGVICAPPSLSPTGREFVANRSVSNGQTPNEGAVRLVAGLHQCEGRVEVFSGSEWGTVCDDAWDIPDAQVVCNQLGCGEAAVARPEAFFGPGAGPILLDNLKCRGDESSLQGCSHIAWDVHNCDHSEDAGVTCSMS
ncbi:unnamed protein product [Boreogadus saida]